MAPHTKKSNSAGTPKRGRGGGPNWVLSITRVAMLLLVFGIVAAGILLYEMATEPAAAAAPVAMQPGRPDAAGNTRAPLVGPGVVKETAREVAAWVWFLVAVVVAALAAFVLWHIRYLAHRFLFAEHYVRPIVAGVNGPLAERAFGPDGDDKLRERLTAMVVGEKVRLANGDARGDLKGRLKEVSAELEQRDLFANRMFPGLLVGDGRVSKDDRRKLRDVANWFADEYLGATTVMGDAVRPVLAATKFSRDGDKSIEMVYKGVYFSGGMKVDELRAQLKRLVEMPEEERVLGV